MFHPTRMTLLVALVAGLGLMAPHPASAQSADAQSQYSEDELKSFVVATMEIKDITDVYKPRIESASSSDKKAGLHKEATNKMISAIQSAGLTVDRFNQIATRARSDPEFLNKLEGYRAHMQQ